MSRIGPNELQARNGGGSVVSGAAGAAGVAGPPDGARAAVAELRRTVEKRAEAADAMRELQAALAHMQAENAMMEEVLSEPHQMVTHRDIAGAMTALLPKSADGGIGAAILQQRKEPVLSSVARARGRPVPQQERELRVPSQRVSYGALLQEQRESLQRMAEGRRGYDALLVDLQRQQARIHERFDHM